MSRSEFDIDEVQSEALDLQPGAELVVEHLSCATSCETVEDLRANLAEALDCSLSLSKELRALLQRLPKKAGQSK